MFALALPGVRAATAADATTALQGLPAPTTGESGLPIPRFISLTSNTAFLRAGPGSHYPIDWVYKRSGLPLIVVDEFDNWRKVRDSDGVSGWFHVTLLSGKRTALIQKKKATLHKKPDSTSPIVITAEGGVTGQLINCKNSWCLLQINKRQGWIPSQFLFGVLPGETTIP